MHYHELYRKSTCRFQEVVLTDSIAAFRVATFLDAAHHYSTSGGDRTIVVIRVNDDGSSRSLTWPRPMRYHAPVGAVRSPSIDGLRFDSGFLGTTALHSHSHAASRLRPITRIGPIGPTSSQTTHENVSCVGTLNLREWKNKGVEMLAPYCRTGKCRSGSIGTRLQG